MSGRVQVFAVPTDVVPSARSPLVAAGEGDLIIPPPPGVGATLIAVGIDQATTVRPVETSALRRLVAGAEGDVVVRMVETWLDAVAAALRHPLPEHGTSLTVGETTRLRAGDAAWPATRIVWLPTSGAAFGLFDLATRSRGDAVLPLPAQAWLRAHSEADVTPIPGSEALATEAAWQGIDRFQFSALAQLRSVLDQADDDAAERTARRHAHEADLRASTYSGFVGIFGGPHRASPAGHPAGELLAAMQSVGAAQHIEIVSPTARAVASATDPIDAIARASGVRARMIRLEPNWWHTDTEPFIGALEEDGNPVAVVR